jgi:hypothetical protein
VKKIVWPGILAGVAILIVEIFITTNLFYFLFPSMVSEYKNISIFRPWNDPLMSLYFLYPFLLGLVLAWFWNKTKNLFKGKEILKRGLRFAWTYFIIAGLPGMFITYSSFQLSWAIVLSWTVGGFIDAFIAGWIFAKMNG